MSEHIRPKKRLGQNFLTDPNTISKIVRLSEVREGDTVLEIGPGTGVMTEELLSTGCGVVAVELDKDLIPVLARKFEGDPKFRLVHQDILKADLSLLCREYGGGAPWKVVANLPYYITTPILFKLLEEGGDSFSSITVMVQKEVAERMVAPPGGKEYGALSGAVQYHSNPRIKMTVPRTVFYPRPEVESAVVTLELSGKTKVGVADEGLFFQTVKAAFSQRRKTIRNTLISGFEGRYSPSGIEAALSEASIDPSRRGETLSVEEFAKLSDAIKNTRTV